MNVVHRLEEHGVKAIRFSFSPTLDCSAQSGKAISSELKLLLSAYLDGKFKAANPSGRLTLKNN